MDILEVVLFLLAFIGLLYLPGSYILRRFTTPNPDIWIRLLLSFTIGVSLFLIATYLLSWYGLEKMYYIFAIVVSLLEVRHTFRKSHKSFTLDRYSWYLIFILIFSSSLMSYVMVRSGSYDAGGNLLFYGVNSVDAIWHIALIENLAKYFPPTHPGISGIPLRGYNFFYDLLLANFQKLYPFSVMDLYFRYFAVTLSLFFGIASLAFARFVKMGKVGALLFLFLSYFAQGFGGYVLSILSITYHSPVVQSVAHAVDPNVLFSMILFYGTYILLFNKKPSYLVVLLFAILPMVKIYTAILAFAGLGVVACTAFLAKRELKLGKIFVCSAVSAAILYLPINFGAGSLVFAPFLVFKHYMESGAVIPSYKWILKYQVYQEHGNLLRIIQLYIISIFLFFIPSLGIRMVSIFTIKQMFQRKFYTQQHIYLFAVIVTGILIPSFFIQSVAVFVVVQFFWIVYLLLLIPTAFTMERIIGRVTIIKSVITALLLILLCLPETIATIRIYSIEPLVIHSDLVKTIQAIPKSSDDVSILVLNDAYKNAHLSGVDTVPIVSGLSGKSTYFEPEVLDFLHGERLTKHRKELVFAIMDTLEKCINTKQAMDVLKKTKSEYMLTYQQYSCLNTLASVRKIHTSGSYSLHEVTTE